MTGEAAEGSLLWRIVFHPDAAKDVKKLDRKTAARILRSLETRIAPLEDPRTLGAPLKGEHDAHWRWRFGDYRVIARIDDARLTILVIRVAHRREAYR